MLDCQLHSYIPSPLLQKLPQLLLFLHLDEPRIVRNGYSSTVKVAPPQPKEAALNPQLLAQHTWPEELALVRTELAFRCGCYSQHWEHTESVAYLYILPKIHTLLISAAADHT